MGRAFSAENKDRIRRNLIQKGRAYFIKYGIRKTSVDELAKAAGIAKGSFYKFFDSKEALFMAIHEESEARLQQEMIMKLEAIHEPIERLRFFLQKSFLLLEEDPLLQLVFNPGEMEAMAGYMSSEHFKEHYRQDISFMAEMISRWQEQGVIRPDIDVTVAGNMIASVYHIALQQEDLGKDMYNRVTAMLVDCLTGYLSVA
ncbi:MAG: TetR/AcrR family transcriptional regulator [Dehalococcoidales bacterium]|nr:TetR/AcrR family transcriptional regulator [Dehalococcoidales bacterium]